MTVKKRTGHVQRGFHYAVITLMLVSEHGGSQKCFLGGPLIPLDRAGTPPRCGVFLCHEAFYRVRIPVVVVVVL